MLRMVGELDRKEPTYIIPQGRRQAGRPANEQKSAVDNCQQRLVIQEIHSYFILKKFEPKISVSLWCQVQKIIREHGFFVRLGKRTLRCPGGPVPWVPLHNTLPSCRMRKQQIELSGADRTVTES